MSYETLILFFLTDLAFCLSPGPATIVTAAHAINGGMRNAIGPILGIHIGNFIWYGLSALGLVALIQAAPNLYTAIRWAGVAYLIWIGMNMLRQKSGDLTYNQSASKSLYKGFLSGLAVHMSNPKALLFYAAFLPQFIDPTISILFQISILAAITVITESIGLFFYAGLASGVRHMANKQIGTGQTVAKYAHKTAAIFLILVAATMAFLNFYDPNNI